MHWGKLEEKINGYFSRFLSKDKSGLNVKLKREGI